MDKDELHKEKKDTEKRLEKAQGVSPAEKYDFWPFSIRLVVILLLLILIIQTIQSMPSGYIPFSKRHYTCEALYSREARIVGGALIEYVRADKPFPTLDEMVADGLYTLPQDRELRAGNYAIDPRDLRVKLIHIDHPYKWFAYKVIITSTRDRCTKGNTFIYSSSDYEGEWLDRQLAH